MTCRKSTCEPFLPRRGWNCIDGACVNVAYGKHRTMGSCLRDCTSRGKSAGDMMERENQLDRYECLADGSCRMNPTSGPFATMGDCQRSCQTLKHRQAGAVQTEKALNHSMTLDQFNRGGSLFTVAPKFYQQARVGDPQLSRGFPNRIVPVTVQYYLPIKTFEAGEQKLMADAMSLGH